MTSFIKLALFLNLELMHMIAFGAELPDAGPELNPTVRLCIQSQNAILRSYSDLKKAAKSELQPHLDFQISFLNSVLKDLKKDLKSIDRAPIEAYLRHRKQIAEDYYFSEAHRQRVLNESEGYLDMFRGAVIQVISEREQNLLNRITGKTFAERRCPEGVRGHLGLTWKSVDQVAEPVPTFGGKPFQSCGTADALNQAVAPELERRFSVRVEGEWVGIIAATWVRTSTGPVALESRLSLRDFQMQGADLESAIRFARDQRNTTFLYTPQSWVNQVLKSHGACDFCNSAQAKREERGQEFTIPQQEGQLPLQRDTQVATETTTLPQHLNLLGPVDLGSQSIQTEPQVIELSPDSIAGLCRLVEDHATRERRESIAKFNAKQLIQTTAKQTEVLLEVTRNLPRELRDSIRRGSREVPQSKWTQVLSNLLEKQRFDSVECQSNQSGKAVGADFSHLKLAYPVESFSSCPGVPQQLRRAFVKFEDGRPVLVASTLLGHGQSFVLLRTQWDLTQNSVTGTRWEDALIASNSESFKKFSQPIQIWLQHWLDQAGLLDLCRPDVRFLENSPDLR